MESAHAVKAEDTKKSSHPAAKAVAAVADGQMDGGATRGMPMFLQRSANSASPIQRQMEEIEPAEEPLEEDTTGEQDTLQTQLSTTTPLVQRQEGEEEPEQVPLEEEPEAETETIQTQSLGSASPLLLQRKCAECSEADAENPDEDQAPQIQRLPLDNPEEEDETLEPATEAAPANNSETVQPQLKIGQPGDAFEQEADQMADQVMGASQPGAPQIQAKCTSCETDNQLQTKQNFPELPDLEPASPEEAPAMEASATAGLNQDLTEAASQQGGEQGKEAPVKLPDLAVQAPEEEIPPIQPRTQPGSNRPRPQTPALHNALQQNQGQGHPLPSHLQGEMAQHFSRDFSSVRIHTDDAAVQMNQALNARAFTHGQDIYFNSGEYHPDSSGGKHLLAHELTHTVQQGAVGDVVQRKEFPDQRVNTEPTPTRPNDGAEVTGRMNEKINNDPNVQDQDDLSEEDRAAAENPDRGEVRQESGAIAASGESRPSVDRGAEAEEKAEAQKEQIDEQVESQPEEAAEGEAAQSEEENAELSEAEAATQRAQAAEQLAQAVPVPDQPQPFNHPRIDAPVDSAGEPLPRNSQVDTQVRGLGYIGEMLRDKGYDMKRHAAEKEMGSHALDAVLERQRADLANAEEGTATMATHNQARQDIAQQSHEALGESVERQQFVAEKAPDLASKADEGQTESSELASEAQDKAGQSQSEIPDDPDARADAEQQSGDMQNAASGAESMDQAIQQTGERARQYEQDAAAAAEQNLQSEAQITETEEIIAQTDERISAMEEQNTASQAQIEQAGPGPALIRRHAEHTAQSGDQLIAATVVMEAELNALQEQYLADMAGIESREAAIERQQQEQESSEPEQLSPEEQQLFELAAMDEDEQAQQIAQMEQPERDRLLQTLNDMITRAPDQGTNATEGARLRVDTGLSQAIMGEQAADPRAETIQQVENRRVQRVGGVLDVADQNMTFLTQEQQQMLANRLVAESITDDIANIDILQMGKQMIMAMIDPRQSLVGIVGGFEKMLTGFANIGNWEAWQRDPLGNLLQIAADISTGLAMVFSTILGIAGIITALMVAITILSWGTLSWMTGPVIGWMGTVMTYAGWGALISGSLAVYFNYLAYIKNLHDAGTAETARELFGNTEQMKQNASDGFQGAMAVVEGVGAVKMGPKLSSGEVFQHVPRSPGQLASQTMQGIREGASAVASAPGRIARGARRLLSGGREGLMRFKDRIQRLFSRRRPGDVDMDTGSSGATPSRSQLDAARSKSVQDMDGPEFRAEMQEVGQNRPKRIDPDSEHFADYDVEIQANGHTYRRRKDGRGWCRFSAQECGIKESDLPESAQNQVKQLDSDVTATTERQTGREQAKANNWPEEPPSGYEWYSGPDGKPRVRNKPGNDGPVLEYDPATQTFVEKPSSTPKPDLRAVEAEKAKLAHSDLEGVEVEVEVRKPDGTVETVNVDAKARLKELELERSTAQKRKQTAKTAGDEATASKAHGEMVRASEELGEVATDAAVKRQMPNAQRLDSELPGGQKTGEFDRIYKDGEDVYIYEAKGAGSSRGSRETSKGKRAEQGTPEYREDIVRNMQESVNKHKRSAAYRDDPEFRQKVDDLQKTIDEIELAELEGRLHYMQVNQKVDSKGVLKEEIEITRFGDKSQGDNS